MELFNSVVPTELCFSLYNPSPSLSDLILAAMEDTIIHIKSISHLLDPLLALCSQDCHMSIYDHRIVFLNGCRSKINFMEKVLEFSFMDDTMTFEAHIVDDKTKLFYRRFVPSGLLTSAQFLEFISNVLHDVARGE